MSLLLNKASVRHARQFDYSKSFFILALLFVAYCSINYKIRNKVTPRRSIATTPFITPPKQTPSFSLSLDPGDTALHLTKGHIHRLPKKIHVPDSFSPVESKKAIVNAAIVNNRNNNELPPMEIGMVNVTYNGGSYQILSQNKKTKLIAIPFSKENIPDGYNAGDVNTYIYDKITMHWRQLKRDSIDLKENIIYSTGTEDGDYINAIIKAPEAPETAGFTPTTLKDLKLGDPASMIQLLQPPVANSDGNATLNFHIESPQGRQGIEPNINIAYSSDNANGILGEGWNLNGISNITVETRWGVPQYKSAVETETYLLDGQMLSQADMNDNLNIAHRNLNITRNNAVTEFFRRREINADRIERLGALGDYVWVITDKNGIKYYYGGTISGNNATLDAVLRDEDKIAEWKLRKVVDQYDNSIEYIYKPSEVNFHGNIIKSINIEKIRYTISKGDKARTNVYELDFSYKDRDLQKDFTFNARYGFLSSVNSKILDFINISSIDHSALNDPKPENISKYKFNYSIGSFNKLVLDSISKYGYYEDTEKFFYSQKFGYFSVDSLNGKLFSPVSIAVPMNEFLGKSNTKGKLGFGGAVGIGAPDFQIQSKSLSFNTRFSYKENSSEAAISFVDMNGDGKPDILKKDGDQIKYKPNTSTFDKISFGAEQPVSGIDGFSLDDGSSFGVGVETNGPTRSRIYGGVDHNTSNNYSKKYFTDANGDGLLDVVENGQVKFNTFTKGAPRISFSNSSGNTGNPLIIGSGPASDLVTEDKTRQDAELVQNIKISPLHDVVKIWVAPDSGIIRIDAPVKLLQPVIPENEDDSAMFEKADGVVVSIQKNSSKIFGFLPILAKDYSIKNISNLVTTVAKGDKIVFRVQSGDKDTSNGDYDRVLWNPTIKYTSKNKDRHYFDAFDRNTFEYNSLKDHQHVTGVVNLPDSGKYSISGIIKKPVTKDSIIISIRVNGKILLNSFDTVIKVKRSAADGGDTLVPVKNFNYDNKDLVFLDTLGTEAQTVPINFVQQPYAYNTSISFAITPMSNFKLDSIEWRPKIAYNYYDTAESKTKSDSIYCYPAINFKGELIKPGVYIKAIDSGLVRISPILQLAQGKGPVTMIISDKDSILFKKKIDQSIFLRDTFSFPRNKGELFTVSYEVDSLAHLDTTIITGKIPSYLLLPFDIANWVVPQTGSYSFFGNGKNTIKRAVFSKNGVDSSKMHNSDTLANIFLKENDVISFPDTINRQPVPFSVMMTQASAIFEKWTKQDYGNLYRGWGQGVVNATGYLTSPIPISFLELKEEQKNNFYETRFFSMPFDPRERHYTGVNKKAYIGGDTMSSSRLAMANVHPIPLFVFNGTVNTAGARAVVKYSKTRGTTAAIGGSGFTINQSIDAGTQSYSDYIDLNGDRHPDIVGQASVQFTNSLGGLQSTVRTMNAGLQGATTNSQGVNLGGVFFEPFLISGRSPGQASNKTSGAGAKLASVLSGFSGGINTNKDDVDVNLVDMNGDGLPDKVTKNGNVLINLGESFSSAAIPWNFGNIQSTNAVTTSLGGGINIDNNSISAGVTVAKTDAEQQNAFIDLNSDGLNDKVINSGSGVSFALNSGVGISSAANQRISLNSSFDITHSTSSSLGINGAFTWCPHIIILVPICKIVFSVSTNIGSGSNVVKSQWTDVNGDGFIDYIKDNGEGTDIMISNLGKINRLKNVSGPLGASYTIDYKHNKANFDHPGGKWVMESLITDDGDNSDGQNAKSVFEYDGGKYDRFEREFLGFQKVVTTEFLNNAAFRKYVTEYNNDNYFYARSLAKQWVENSGGAKYAVKENEYYSRIRTKKVRNNIFPSVPTSLLKVVVMQTPVKLALDFAQEGGVARILSNQTVYNYDSLLNVSSYSYKEGESKTQQQQSSYKAEIRYKSIGKDIYGLPESVIVRNVAGAILKKVTAIYPANFKGKLESSTVIFADNSSAITKYLYNGNSGNLIKKTNPDGKEEVFEYETKFQIYPSKIIDAYKLVNTFEYDYRFGLDTVRTLTNGAKIKTRYDVFGRTVKIQGPRQSNLDMDNADFTIKVEYRHADSIPYAIVRHFDEVNTEDGIYTINFVDGFGRNIQVKKTGVVSGIKQWIVSGRQHYDELQRLQRSYYQRTQAYDVGNDMNIGDAGRNMLKGDDIIPPTIYTYDVLDRLLTTRLPNKKLFETNEYALKQDGFSALSAVTISTYTENAKQSKREIYTNGSGLKSSEVFYIDTTNEKLKKTTRFSYDPLHQLDSVINMHNGKDFTVMTNAYDWAGRKTRHGNISSGVCTYDYDKLNNLVRKTTAKGEVVEHDYEHRRLVRTRYPAHPEDSVRYVYSDKDPTSTYCLGKLIFQVDATGAQSFRYDEFGNIIENRRTIIAPFDTTYTFSSTYKYDSWGRQQQMVYPSGEEVNYRYNIAGNLSRVYGTNHDDTAVTFRYVNDISYDKFEQRQSLTYGNGLLAIYKYNDTMRRLQSLTTKKGATEIMVSNYEYDDLNNVKLNTNRSALPGLDAVNMRHDYRYNNLNQLDSAHGQWNSATTYDLRLGYDEQLNLQSKSLNLSSPTIKRTTNSVYRYKQNNPLQLVLLKDHITRTNSATGNKYREVLTASHFYDDNGNDVYTSIADTFQANVNERKILWDEENRIRAISNNGYINVYGYDANGNRTLKMSSETESVYVNGRFAGTGTTKIASYSLYVNPYFSVRNARGIGTKHIYIGKERILSQLTNYNEWPTADNDAATVHPEKDTVRLDITLVADNKRIQVRFGRKMLKTESLVNSYFDSLEVPHTAILHNALTKNWPALVYPLYTDPSKQDEVTKVTSTVDATEKLQYFYHSNYLGSASFISDREAAIVQYVEYLPFGETFMEQRKSYSSQFLFNGKEQDQETGLYYYGARYYDPATYQWLSVDPMGEQYPGLSPYNYCLGNPIIYTDPDGKLPIIPMIWAAFEIGSAIYDGYEAYQTLSNNDATLGEKTAAVVGVVLGAGLPGGGYGSAAKASAKAVDKIADGSKILDQANDTKKMADFVVTPNGTTIPVSQSKMKEGFERAGFKKEINAKTPEPGSIYTVPSKNGMIKVRTMEGSAHNPQRAVFSADGVGPVKVGGEKLRPNVTRDEARKQSHLLQKD